MTGPSAVRREVASSLVAEVVDPTSFVLAVAVSPSLPTTVESLRIRLDGEPVEPRPVDDVHGGRLHVFDTGPGTLTIEYAATIVGRAAPAARSPLDLAIYTRPSRYMQSDALTPFARDTFAGREGPGLVGEVAAWVHDRLSYVPEASSPTGGAVETLEAGAGVCRDYAHLTAALLRALDVPARMVSVYAPGLEPRDFHAVVEALVDERWVLVDATRLAPRARMVRISTGRDAADVAFLSNTLADIRLLSLNVVATTDDLPVEDPDELIELG